MKAILWNKVHHVSLGNDFPLDKFQTQYLTLSKDVRNILRKLTKSILMQE